jgi:hypothetical protein
MLAAKLYALVPLQRAGTLQVSVSKFSKLYQVTSLPLLYQCDYSGVGVINLTMRRRQAVRGNIRSVSRELRVVEAGMLIGVSER